jgi:putative transposase
MNGTRKKTRADREPICDKCSTPSSSACVAAVNGTNFPNATAATAPPIAGSSASAKTAFLTASGDCWSKPVRIWPVCIGTGRVPTVAWAKPATGGKKVGKNPTDRGKAGTKTSLLVDEHGGPLGVVIDAANVPDCKLLEATIEAIVVARPEPTPESPQHLCLDKGYDNPTGQQAANAGGHTPHIRRIGEEKKACERKKGHKPRRWVVERTLSWLCKCRAILVRYDKHARNYLGLIQLACATYWYRRLCRLCNEPVLG